MIREAALSTERRRIELNRKGRAPPIKRPIKTRGSAIFKPSSSKPVTSI
jgi:hypothetical protein